MRKIRKNLTEMLYSPEQSKKYSSEISSALGKANYKHLTVLMSLLLVISIIYVAYYYNMSKESNISYTLSFLLYSIILIFSIITLLFMHLIAKKWINEKEAHKASTYTFINCFIVSILSVFITLSDQLLSSDISCFFTVCFVCAGAFYFNITRTLILYGTTSSILLILMPYAQDNKAILDNNIMSIATASIIIILLARLTYNGKVREIIIKKELEYANNKREEQMMLMQKCLSRESLAEITHNLKNPLVVSIGYAELIKSALPNSELPDKLVNAIEKIEGIVKTILRNAKKQDLAQLQEVDLNQIIENEIQLIKTAGYAKHNVNIICELEKNLAPYKCVSSHISQSISNLLVNAFDAMFQSSTKILTIKTYQISDKVIVINISDTGQGIAKENIKNVFEPFYTTKQSEKTEEDQPVGNGLGLAYAKRIIEQYNGKIEIESELDKGTTITVTLPINNHLKR